MKKGEKGIRILAPIMGVRRKPDGEAEKDITKQNRTIALERPVPPCVTTLPGNIGPDLKTEAVTS